jgi:hypothetical protein
MTNNRRWEREPKKNNCWAGEDSHTCARGIIQEILDIPGTGLPIGVKRTVCVSVYHMRNPKKSQIKREGNRRRRLKKTDSTCSYAYA